MGELVAQISAIWIFLGIAAIGFIFLLVSFVFGEIFELGELHHDFGDGPGFLSTRIISVFLTAFGGFGAVGLYHGYGLLLSSTAGLVGGVTLGGLMFWLARWFYAQQATSLINITDLIGRTAQVTVSIPSNGVGQVRCVVGESMIDKIAQSRDGSAIPHNSLVRIEEIVGEAVIVGPVSSSRVASSWLQR